MDRLKTTFRTPHTSDANNTEMLRPRLRPVKAKIQYTSSKSVTSWRGKKSIVSVVSCRFPNSITTTSCQLVADLLASPSSGKLRGNVCNGLWALSNSNSKTADPSAYHSACVLMSFYITENTLLLQVSTCMFAIKKSLGAKNIKSQSGASNVSVPCFEVAVFTV